MTLSVTVVRSPGQASGEQRQVQGGKLTIGRGAQCDWVLPDPQRSLSRTHCQFEQADGGWQLRDLSSNGTFVNGEADAVGAGAVRPLRDGDQLRLGDYELELRLRQPAARAPEPSLNPFGSAPSAGGFFSPGAQPFGAASAEPFPSPFASPAASSFPGVSAGSGADPYGFASAAPSASPPAFGAESPGRSSAGGFAGVRLPGLDDPVPAMGVQRRPSPELGAMPDHSPAASDAFIPHAVLPGDNPASAAPDDWFRSALLPHPNAASKPAPQPAPVAPQRQPEVSVATPPPPLKPVVSAPPELASEPARGDATLAALALLMQAGGLPPDTIHRAAGDPQASLRQAGAVLLAAVAGMRALLVARGLVKREFRIEQTLLRPKENNPLKFAASDEQALASLLDPRTRGLQAVRDAVQDLTAHEVAVLAATQAAARSMLEGLSPALMEAEDDGGGLLPGATEKRLWQSYKRRHAKLLAQLEDDFESAFGRAFAKAYEQALDKGDRV